MGVDQQARSPVRQREVTERRPQRIGGNVLYNHRLTSIGRGAARSHARTDGHAIDGAAVYFGQARRRGVAQVKALVIEQQNRGKQIGVLGLNEAQQSI